MMDLITPEFIDWLSTLTMAVGGALIISGIFSIGWARLFGLRPEYRLWAFIVGFALVCGLTTAPATPVGSWSSALYSHLLPVMIAFIYFLPTAVAISARNAAFQSIFILNLFFGWTLVGWFVAMGWALRPGPLAGRPGYRITPFGAVPDRGDGQPKAS